MQRSKVKQRLFDHYKKMKEKKLAEEKAQKRN